MTSRENRPAGNGAAQSWDGDTNKDTPPTPAPTQNTLVRWSPPDPLPRDAVAAAMCACFIGDVAVPDLIRRIETIA